MACRPNHRRTLPISMIDGQYLTHGAPYWPWSWTVPPLGASRFMIVGKWCRCGAVI